MAEAHGPRAVCVVLSGTGADGSMGLRRIKERDGAVFVQNPKEAEFNEMPRSAIATDLVDDILPLAEIIPQIIAYKNSLGTVQIVLQPELRPEEEQNALREIFGQLKLHTGNDFSSYKRPTLLRRIERRISIRHQPTLVAYAEYLKQNPDETKSLLKDLLISVTNFFRDKHPFATVEKELVPNILSTKSGEQQVRIWVAGCATGEEAYSLAMLFAEHTFGSIDAPKVQIFATDIDEAAISVGREGYYTLNDAADIPLERLRRFFNKEGDGYRVRREIREMVVFAAHNFLKAPPFSKLDLISCRNVLIYLNHAAQERVMETFHFALNPGGFLFLGTSESVDSGSDLYSVFNRENHIFQSRMSPNKSYAVPGPVPDYKLAEAGKYARPEERERRLPSRVSFGDIHQKMLVEYAPPSVMINGEYEILHMSGNVGDYMKLASGEPTQNLLKLVVPGLRLELRSALYQAAQHGSPVQVLGLKIELDGKAKSINIHVRPVLTNVDNTKGYIVVLFEENKAAIEGGETILIAAHEPIAKHLEDELSRLKDQLRSSIEHHDIQAEDLKASNEEFQSMNEELRSTAEELETSKEELQSINEELRTVNQELKVKIDETNVTSSNLHNFINSADIGTIFLDRGFRIRMFTPAVRDIFNLIPSDHGRPISDITNKLGYPGLLEDADTVLEKLSVIDKEVIANNGRYYTVRMLPYRTHEDRINGVVITFFDITNRKTIEKALGRSEARLRLVIESAKDYAIFTLDTDRHIISWSIGATAIIGYGEKEIIGKLSDITFSPEDRANDIPEKELKKAELEGHVQGERWHLRKDGSRFWGSGSISPLRDGDGKLLGYVSIMRDLSETRRLQENLRLTEERQSFLLKLSDTLRKFSGLMQAMPDEACRLLGQFLGAGRVVYAERKDGDTQFICTGQFVNGMDRIEGAYPLEEQIPELLDQHKTARITFSESVALEKKLAPAQRSANRALGIGSWLAASLLKKGTVDAILMVHFPVAHNWTSIELGLAEESAERVWLAIQSTNAETALRESNRELIHVLESLNDAFYSIDAGHNITYINKKAEGYWQRDRKEMLGRNLWEVFPEAVGTELARMHGVAIAENRAVYLETVSPLRDYWIEVNIYPNSRGGLSVYFRDINERKKNEEELTRQVRERTIELQRSNDDLRQFAHVASHDLKEPVRKISVFNTKLMDEFSGVLPERAKLYLDKVQISAERMQAMIDGVLNYSKFGSTEQHLAPVDLNGTIGQIENDLEVLIDKKRAVITTDGLPTLQANGTLMYQLFYNLILNALKFSKTNEPSLINITSEPIKKDRVNYTAITVADNGIGFDDEFKQSIFETFTRLHPVSEYEGTGLGLALCKKIAERHHGEIFAEGKKGEGAIFTVLLPSA